MGAGYEFFEHTADIGVRVHGADQAELFTNAAQALYATLGRWELSTERRELAIELEAADVADLLHDWLGELLFVFETQGLVLDRFEFAPLSAHHLRARCSGAVVDQARFEPHLEIKAVTYHQLQARQEPDGQWVAQVIFDV
jgi:SHS2 domain-containing protein